MGFAVEPDGAPVAGRCGRRPRRPCRRRRTRRLHLPDSRFGADAHAPGLVAVGCSLEQESGALDVAGQVAQFVDDRRFGLADRLGFGVEVVVVFGFA